MLNEKKEYEQYTCDLSKDMTQRLKYGNIVNQGSGIERIMTVIITEFIDKASDWFNPASDTMQKDIIAAAKELLMSWSGYNHQDENTLISDMKSLKEEKIIAFSEYYHKIENWLSTYILYMVYNKIKSETLRQEISKNINERITIYELQTILENLNTISLEDNSIKEDKLTVKNIKETVKILVDREKSVVHPIFNRKTIDKYAQNSFKMLHLEDVIAAAINNEKLKERVLVSVDGPLDKSITQKGQKGKTRVVNKKTAKKNDLIKYIVYCLLRSYDFNNKTLQDAFFFVVLSDIGNWCENQKDKIKASTDDFYYYEDSLFEKDNLSKDDSEDSKGRSNTVKIKLCSTYIQDMNGKVFIVDDEDVLNNDRKIYDSYKERMTSDEPMVIYRDKGSGASLETVYYDKNGKKITPEDYLKMKK